MTENAPRKPAEERRSLWIGWIWGVPVAALGIVVWLAVREFSKSGPSVTVTFDTAGGVEAGTTKVKYKDMDVGHVSAVQLRKDLHHVDITLELDSEFDDQLGPRTRFWIAGANVRLTDLSSIKAAVLGPFIGIDPVPGSETDHFTGLDAPPIVKSDAKGASYVLHTNDLDSINVGSPIHYLGLTAGEVRAVTLSRDNHGVDLAVFVQAPYDKLVHRNSQFWVASAVRLSMQGGAPRVQTSLPALVGGAIAFRTEDMSAPIAPPASEFHLYKDKDSAINAPGPQAQTYLVTFRNTGSRLAAGAPVELAGARVGIVRDVMLGYDPQSGELRTQATIDLEPKHIAMLEEGGWRPDARPQMDALLEHLIARGLRAQLAVSPPAIGGAVVRLCFVPDAKPAHLDRNRRYPQIPTTTASDIDQLIASLNDIAAQVDAIPLTQIGGDVHTTTRHVAKLAGSPELRQSLDHLNRSLANVDAITTTARGEVGPTLEQARKTVTEAQQTIAAARALLAQNGGISGRPGSAGVPDTLYEMSRAARALRELSDYLDRHPEALLEGKATQR